MRKHIADGNAALDRDARQAQWYADLAARTVAPAQLEPAQLLRCKVRSSFISSALIWCECHAELGEK